jgi:hypothetical protein
MTSTLEVLTLAHLSFISVATAMDIALSFSPPSALATHFGAETIGMT